MTFLEQARKCIEDCHAYAAKDDDEAAHGYEDDAVALALSAAIADEPGWQDVAREALALAELDFARWCA